MNKIYSSKGDDGFTGILGEGRIPKYHPRIETVGALDEASAALGMARALANNSTSAQLRQRLDDAPQNREPPETGVEKTNHKSTGIGKLGIG